MDTDSTPEPPSPPRRPFHGLLRLGACIVVVLGLAGAAHWQWRAYQQQQQQQQRLANASFPETPWATLVPAGWDPLKRFREQAQAEGSDTSAGAQELARDMRKTWDNAPTNAALNGAALRLRGYVVPLQADGDALREFLLVPYFGACIHTPPPPANQIVHVTLATPIKHLRTMDPVAVNGTLLTQRRGTAMGMSGYTMLAVRVDKAMPRPPR